ncbi:amino acid transporter [Grosmannia clavigera kw1407]|uniref:Amino acid transporter n=1 Tax=Grosmannia clavigera (strain kw1407 / UAMH 11150) TaxID=655863 RepID=F0XKA4_GROCL|nr:amino acid transporter [Grosmannia clavigera kw1407]EFX01864.1 amino acid transporter [Grosmannia clavigera kw1407]
MTNYSTISADSGRSSPGDMSRRRRRGRSPKGGGGEASMLSSIINLLNTIVGAGTLAMPAAMSHMGVVLGTVVIIWAGITSAFGLYLQSRCARYLDRGQASFFALSQITYPNAAIVFDTAIAIKCFGVGVSYLIIIGDLMPGVTLGFSSHAADVPYLVDRNFWITVFILFIIPLAYLRRLDSLKYTSIIALVAIGYLVVLVVYHFASDIPTDRGEVRIITWEGPVAMLRSLPVVVFAYTCHQNMFSILNEIKDTSPASVAGVITTSIGSAASVYILVAITGYLTFGSHVIGNIVAMYPPNIASTIGKAAIVVLVTFSVPLQVHPCRASLDAILKWRPNKAKRSLASSASSSVMLPTVAPTDSHGSPVVPMSDLRFAALTTVIIIFSYLTALSMSSLDRVLAYIGSTGSTSISFILPGLFFYKISDPDSMHHQRLMKEDDDAEAEYDSSDEDTEINPDEASLLSGVPRGSDNVGGFPSRRLRNRKKWRWDLEHLEHGLLRKMALGIAIYGFLVMIVCLVLNTFFGASH